MEELQDAIEDAQYVNAINTQEDGPRPVLAWEQPTTPEAMDAWCAKKKWDLDSLLESAIAFFLFSHFLKTKHSDYLRINFCEDVLRFKKMRGRTRRKQAEFIMENYMNAGSKKKKNTPGMTKTAFSATSSVLRDLDSSNHSSDHGGAGEKVSRNSAASESNGEINDSRTEDNMPPRTEIEECDLERKAPNSRANAYLKEDGSFKIYCDYPKCAQTKVGIRDAILEDLIDDWKEWEEQERKLAAIQPPPAKRQTSAGDNSLGGPGKHGSNHSKGGTPRKPSSSGSKGSKDEGAATTESATKRVSLEGSDNNKVAADAASGELPATTGDNGTVASTVTPPPEQPKEDASIASQSSKTLEKTISGMSLEEFGEATTSMRVLTQKFKSQKDALHDALFDKAETVVMESLRREYWQDFLQSEEFQKCRNFLWYQDRPTVPDDFYIMRVLGRGGFGLVNACKKGTSGKLYAMKMMNKRRIKMKKSEQLAKNEREAMAAVESNFVVNLKYSFHSKEDVYLILDLMTGGDLGFHLHQKGRFPKREVQYYAARIMLGLQALHDKGYVYRDLKPENCLMGDDGRVKITDLGLATKITPTLHGAAGTRGYWAPEMLRRDRRGKRMPYGHTVDWFSFGCCVTEFICGANPFRSEAALNFGLAKGKQTKEKAIDCATLEMEPEFPKEFFEPDAKDLCMRLLEKDENVRLGTGGCEEIMAHPYFKNVNWEAIISDRKRPPFVPAKDVNAASQSEIGNFVEDKTYQETVLDERDEAFYRNWAWTNPRAYATEVIEFLIYERETGEPLLPIAQNAGCCCVVL
uniref:G protein-coupled receptor kinase n=1 Tax=Entomoneis paludosa TaxID=265537 RepID=A0A7S2YEW8_9STRA|mmetsp:Transcript_29725/g.62108  ORF Transcript_29725/g.62108 Transcript_29725/m.62108 type:complete len:806 (+) Transcript_29725:942-3359(+)